MVKKKKRIKKEAPKKRGAPCKYDPKIYDGIVLLLAEKSATDAEMAKALKINRATFYEWKKKYPALADVLKRGKAIADTAVVKSLFQRAVGYSHPEDKIFYDSKLGKEVVVETIKHYPPDPVACIFWLKNRIPEDWKDKQVLDGNLNLTYTVKPREKK